MRHRRHKARTTPDDLAAVGLLQEPVRRRLYEWVINQPSPVGRDAAAQAVGINRSLAAFHLDRLTEAGLFEAATGASAAALDQERAGPHASIAEPIVTSRSACRRATTSSPRTYFAAALQQLGDGTPPAALGRPPHTTRACTFQRQHGGAVDEPLFDVLQRAGYEPIEDDATIRLRNCPFDALVDEHRPLVCGTNLALAQGILDGLAGDRGADYQPHLEQQEGYCCVVFTREEEH